MRQVIIKTNDKGGFWTVDLHECEAPTPDGAVGMISPTSNGFQTSGHALAYVKRLAKYNPTSREAFFIAQECGRFYVYGVPVTSKNQY